MDISIVDKDSLKIRGKQTTFIVDPTSAMPKTNADALICLTNSKVVDTSRILNTSIVINGPGEYEVNRAKISAASTPKGIIYKLSIDGLEIILGRTTDFSKVGEIFTNCQVAILLVDEDLNEASVTALEPKLTILYGDKKVEGAKILNSQSQTSSNKLTISKDKLPEKMEVIVLG